MKKLLVILDAGHGGMVNGKYVTAPSKQFKHGKEWIYEGVVNRKVKNSLMSLLKERQIAFADVSSGEEDIPLSTRVFNANMFQSRFSAYQSLYLSIHSNAGGGTGFEVWTSPGKTKSDEYAGIAIQEIRKMFPRIPMRIDMSDGDEDKESKFYVLVHTAMPAILCELLFFDNVEDWKIIKTQKYINDISQALFNFIVRAQKELN